MSVNCPCPFPDEEEDFRREEEEPREPVSRRHRHDADDERHDRKRHAEKLDDVCALGPEEKAVVRAAFDRLGLTARSYTRLLKIARTIADLDGSGSIRKQHLAEALRFRG